MTHVDTGAVSDVAALKRMVVYVTDVVADVLHGGEAIWDMRLMKISNDGRSLLEPTSTSEAAPF